MNTWEDLKIELRAQLELQSTKRIDYTIDCTFIIDTELHGEVTIPSIGRVVNQGIYYVDNLPTDEQKVFPGSLRELNEIFFVTRHIEVTRTGLFILAVSLDQKRKEVNKP